MTDAAIILQKLPAAVYATDADGYLTFCNDAAVEFWGRRPELGTSRWCGAWRLWNPDGTRLDPEDGPLALTLRLGRPVRDVEAVVERPNGDRAPFLSVPVLLHDAHGHVAGAINLMIDVADRGAATIESERLAAIVASSDDAILGKTLDGIVTSWNAGATRIFGYEAEEMIGQSILRIIPPELQHEEAEILAALRKGERIEHFDTVRVAKDGRRVDISLTVSPIRDRLGSVIGASKVARDISERRRSEQLQALLFDELNHRVKNTLATIQAIASQSLRRSASPEDFVDSFNGRVQALARAHDLIVQRHMRGAEITELLHGHVSLGPPDRGRITCTGPRVLLDARNTVQLGLVLHELATNARKHGALAAAAGHLTISWSLLPGSPPELVVDWIESGVDGLRAPGSHGFGTTLIERSLEANGGEAVVRYAPDGLTCHIRLPLEQTLPEDTAPYDPGESWPPVADTDTPDLRGKRILVVEDEPLVAMDVEAQLEELGCIVVGPASTAARARRLIADEPFDAALVDANLNGEAVDDVVAAIIGKGRRFAFATGYGREALPRPYRDAPFLGKPFTSPELVAVLAGLLIEDPALQEPRPAS